MIQVPEISYSHLLALFACIAFFVTGARMDGRSPVVWGGLSLGVWLVFTQLCWSGIGGGIVSQFLLFAALGCYGIFKERRTR